jgi:hypothetical protein
VSGGEMWVVIPLILGSGGNAVPAYRGTRGAPHS